MKKIRPSQKVGAKLNFHLGRLAESSGKSVRAVMGELNIPRNFSKCTTKQLSGYLGLVVSTMKAQAKKQGPHDSSFESAR